MSPLDLRRYRAERLLRSEFQGQRSKVLAIVSGKLRASGVNLNHGDLEACYAQAWQGLYAAIIEGEEVANPTGWLVLVAFRRALDEHRSRGKDRDALGMEADAGTELPQEQDLASELDDRTRLRQVLEGLRGNLSERECQAAALCYLQGLSRAEAAEKMGISQARMIKLMEGKGQGRPGVAGKMGALLQTIENGGWCEEQGSLMRGLAYGIHDPQGERHKLAVAHRKECPACRRYVASLRGLAATLPPVPLPWRLGPAGPHGGSSTGSAKSSRFRRGAVRFRGPSNTASGTHSGALLGGSSAVSKLAVSAAVVVVGASAGSYVLVARGAKSHAHGAVGGSSTLGTSASVLKAPGGRGDVLISDAFARGGTHTRAQTVPLRKNDNLRSATSNANSEFGLERGSEPQASPQEPSPQPTVSKPHTQANTQQHQAAQAQREFGIE